MPRLTFLMFMALNLPAAALAQSEVPSDIADGMYITVEEVRANSEQTFAFFAGADGGPISRQEFVTADVPSTIIADKPERPLLERLFGLLDANGDGQLSRTEWRDRINRDLQFADANGDGRITLKELSNARANMSVGDALGMVF